jgi:hypothetical protein
MVIGQGIMLACIGVALGLGGAFWLTPFVASFLFGIKAWGPVAFTVTPLFLSAVALFAVDPMTALRLE